MPSLGLCSAFARPSFAFGLCSAFARPFARASCGLRSAFVRALLGLRLGVTATSRASLRPPRAPQAPQGCSPLLRARNLGPHADLVRFRPRGRGRCPARRSSARTTRRHRRCTVPNTSRTSRSFRVRRSSCSRELRRHRTGPGCRRRLSLRHRTTSYRRPLAQAPRVRPADAPLLFPPLVPWCPLASSREPHAASPSHGLRDGAKLRISLPLRRRCTHGAPPALPAAPPGALLPAAPPPPPSPSTGRLGLFPPVPKPSPPVEGQPDGPKQRQWPSSLHPSNTEATTKIVSAAPSVRVAIPALRLDVFMVRARGVVTRASLAPQSLPQQAPRRGPPHGSGKNSPPSHWSERPSFPPKPPKTSNEWPVHASV